jgi:hypothetical protein
VISASRVRTRRSTSSRTADLLHGLAGGIVENPFLVAPAGEDGAGVAAAHGDDDVGGAHDLVGPGLGAAEMSMPPSTMAVTAAGLILVAGSEPPDQAIGRSPARCSKKPRAIGEGQ